MRVVFDTNAIVSAALLANSVSGRAFSKALQISDILTSFATLDELNQVLSRPKFDKYITMEDREAFIASFVARCVFVDIVESIVACRDPKDDKFLELAVSGCATCIVSGDEDLRALSPFRGIEVCSPQRFLDLCSALDQ